MGFRWDGYTLGEIGSFFTESYYSGRMGCIDEENINDRYSC